MSAVKGQVFEGGNHVPRITALGLAIPLPYDILRLELTTPQRRPTMTTTLASVPLPCSAAQLENAILKAAHNGHWHDAEVKVHGDKLVITYEDEDA